MSSQRPKLASFMDFVKVEHAFLFSSCEFLKDFFKGGGVGTRQQ